MKTVQLQTLFVSLSFSFFHGIEINCFISKISCCFKRLMLGAVTFLEWLCWLAKSSVAVIFTIAKPSRQDDQNIFF